MDNPDVPPRRRNSHRDELAGLDAFHRFYVAAVPSLYLSLRRLGLTGDEAEDVLQETMYLMLTYDRKIESPLAFARQVAQHEAYRLFKRNARELLSDTAGTDSLWTHKVDDEIAERMTRLDLDRAMDNLTSKERTVVEMAQNGYTPKETAEHLGIDASTVRSHLLNARHKLKEFRSSSGGS